VYVPFKATFCVLGALGSGVTVRFIGDTASASPYRAHAATTTPKHR
jgi:hypothetical protein